MTPAELATKTSVAERYAREWLSHQAASGYLEYEPASGKFTLPPEQAMVFAEPDSPVYLQPAFDMAAVMLENRPLVEPAFRTGKGVSWGNQSQCLFCTTGHFLGRAIKPTSWPPGCRRSTASWQSLSAGRPSPTSAVARILHDIHGESDPEVDFRRLRLPWRRWSRRGAMPSSTVRPRTRSSRSAMAGDFPGKDLDLVTCFDCLHDMGDPVGAARHVRQTLKPDGSWMVVEPAPATSWRTISIR